MDTYVQAVDVTINRRKFRVVNVYSNRRPAEEINWSRLLRSNCIIASDMNAHSQMWNTRAGRAPGNARFWEGIVEDFECRIWNTEEETWWGRNAANHSIIDLTLSIGDVELNWFITGDEHHTGSDYAVIGWEILRLGSAATVETVTGWDMSGWSTTEVHEKEEKAKREKAKKEARATWEKEAGPAPDELYSRAGIDSEAANIRQAMEATLNEHAKKRRVCVRSKVWWTEEITALQKERGRAVRERRQNPTAYGEAQRNLKRAIRWAKKSCWEKYVQGADKEQLWKTVRYTVPHRRDRRQGDEPGGAGAHADRNSLPGSPRCRGAASTAGRRPRLSTAK